MKPKPRILVLSSLFPNPGAPQAGVFIRERMFRVGKELPLRVVAPVAWFPCQQVLQKIKPHFRPFKSVSEQLDGISVARPRFLCFPGIFKSLDGVLMALSIFPMLWRQRREFDVIDAHFAYPDGLAACILGKLLNKKVVVTLRGTEIPHSKKWLLRKQLQWVFRLSDRIFSVSDSLRQHALRLGCDSEKARVIGNGVDTRKFYPLPKAECRARLGLNSDQPVIISVGALVERKGFHRVLEQLPALLEAHSELCYLIVGGGSTEGNIEAQLKEQVVRLGLQDQVRFVGALPPDQLKSVLSAADLFVLATSNEGWANVFLEAMACGLPVITTDVGGNSEVVCDEKLGAIVPFGKSDKLSQAINDALSLNWDRDYILNYAEMNSWDSRINILREEFAGLPNTLELSKYRQNIQR